MIEYIKIIIVSLISGLLEPVAVSSSAHFSFLDNVLNLNESKGVAAFYFSIISIAFSLVAIFFVRKIYAKGFKAVFSKKNTIKSARTYKSMMKNLLISLIPAAVMFIPVSGEKFVGDYFTDYLWKSNIFISAFCCFVVGFILLLALWYAKQKKEKKQKNSGKLDILRLSIYQIPSYIFPGISHISMASTSLIVSDIEETVIMRDVLVYIAPSTFIVGIFRLIRSLLSGIVVDPIMVALCVVFALAGNIIMMNLVSKVNIRKSFLFFAIYSIVMGLFMGISSFMLH